MSTKRSLTLSYTICLISLLLGMFVYLFYRSEDTLICKLFSSVFSEMTHYRWSSYFNSKVPLSYLIIYSIPAGLWVMSATIITFDKKINIFSSEINLAFLPLVYAVGLEFLQVFNLTNGTFDILDILVVLVFWLLGFIYLKQIPLQMQRLSLSPKYIVGSYLILFLADIIA